MSDNIYVAVSGAVALYSIALIARTAWIGIRYGRPAKRRWDEAFRRKDYAACDAAMTERIAATEALSLNPFRRWHP